MKDTTKKNLPLIIGLSIPVLMIIAVAIAIYAPRLFAPQPQYDFVYLGGSNDIYYSQYSYTVINGHLTRSYNNTNYNNYKPTNFVEPQIYAYNANTGQTMEISMEQAQSLNLNSAAVSPDGYEIVMGNYGDGIFPIFSGGTRDYNSRYLKGHGASKKLNLQLPSNNYSYNNFLFLGWIVK